MPFVLDGGVPWRLLKIFYPVQSLPLHTSESRRERFTILLKAVTCQPLGRAAGCTFENPSWSEHSVLPHN
jgi:hypothetical protein